MFLYLIRDDFWRDFRAYQENADITNDWNETLSGIYGEGVDAFITWLSRQTRSANVVNFFVDRDKRRGKPRREPDGS